ncbi:MAG: NifU family protein [Candidatus Brocadiia bacterium]
MIDAEKVKEIIANQIRPALQTHGGDCELVEVTGDGTVKVILSGACRGCPMAQMTIKRGVESKLKEEIPDVKEVVGVEPQEATETE